MNLAFKYIIYFITAIVLLTGCRAVQQEPVHKIIEISLKTKKIKVMLHEI